MFNMLESIARSEKPRTPVLGCHISKSLEPHNVHSEVCNQHFLCTHLSVIEIVIITMPSHELALQFQSPGKTMGAVDFPTWFFFDHGSTFDSYIW